MSNSSNKEPLYDAVKLLDLMSDPIKFALIFELMRNPETTSLEMKKRLKISGSRIYYYLNQLVDHHIIEESNTEKVSKYLSRRKFKLTNWFVEVFTKLDEEFHDPHGGEKKIFYLFQLYFARMVIEQQVRLIKQIPATEFNNYADSLDLPYQQFFFVNEETLPFIKTSHQEIQKIIFQKYQRFKSMLDIIKNTDHVTIFSTFMTL